VQVVQKSDKAALSSQTYTLSSTDALNYELSVKLVPARCVYVASGWTVAATVGPVPANF